MADSDDQLSFVAEWVDPAMKQKRFFTLTYYTNDGTVEMFDRVSKKPFLRRIYCSTVKPSEFYLGGCVIVLSRQLFLTDYANEYTKRKCTKYLENTLCIIKEAGFNQLGNIMDAVYRTNIHIPRGRMMKSDERRYAKSLYASQLTENFVTLELKGEDAVNVWKKMRGLTCVTTLPVMVQLGPNAEYCLGPNSREEAATELDIFFPLNERVHCNTVLFDRCTCCLIKPHAVQDGNAGKIVQRILDSEFQITAFEFIRFNLPTAIDFYEVYRGVIPKFQDMAAQLSSGSCLALEVTSFKNEGADVVSKFRQLVGPINVDIAKILRPHTLRAVFGEDSIRNAVHCTDLEEDGRLEVEYIFRIMRLE